MSQYILSQVVGQSRGQAGILQFLGFTACLLTMFALATLVGVTIHNHFHPHPEGYLCDGYEGVVVTISSGRKHRGPYKIDGQKVSRVQHHSCVRVVLPHN